MKKFLMVVLMLVAFVFPVFAADDVAMDLIPKIGYLFSPEYTEDGQEISSDSTISVGADFYFNINDSNVALGVGLMWGENTNIANSDKKIGFTNIYGAIKYKFLANDNQEDPLYIYPLGQIGMGITSYDVSFPGASSVEFEDGFYWGLGAGFEYKSVILEFLYGCNYASIKYSDFSGNSETENFTYTAFRINVGYKFAL